MADPTLIVGLAGIAGTLASGAIAHGMTLRLEERRERRDRRRVATDVLRAVRLIDEEMAWSLRALAQGLAIDDWWVGGAGPRLDAWEKYAPAAAGELSPANWRTLAAAAIKVRRIIAMRADLEAHGSSWPDLAWTADVRAHFEDAIGAIKEARILFRPVILGGSTFPEHEGGFWFPAVPELAPDELWEPKRLREWERRREQLRAASGAEPPDPDADVTMVP